MSSQVHYVHRLLDRQDPALEIIVKLGAKSNLLSLSRWKSAFVTFHIGPLSSDDTKKKNKPITLFNIGSFWIEFMNYTLKHL